jgi:hypothetical protein
MRIRTTVLSYVSRLTDAETSRDMARAELSRRGTAAATVVCAVQDGAEWQQRFVEHHRPDAVRILAFPHAVEHLATVGRAVFGAGTAAHPWRNPFFRSRQRQPLTATTHCLPSTC